MFKDQNFGLFQFLMVRLKAESVNDFTNRSVVSIPYGTIKSALAEPDYFPQMLFQFLMVRLKVVFTIDTLIYLKTFQFLMVRLKVFQYVPVFFGESVSIPYGTIKSTLSAFPVGYTLVSIPYGTIKSYYV